MTRHCPGPPDPGSLETARKGPRNNKLTKCLERAQSLPNGVPSGPGSVKCACRAARGSKRLGLSTQDIFSRLLTFIGFLLWLWDKVKHGFRLSFSVQRPPTAIGDRRFASTNDEGELVCVIARNRPTMTRYVPMKVRA